MGIARIDPSLEDAHVTARVRARPRGSGDQRSVDLDVALVPLRCGACGSQLPGLYEHRGSRYGQVGSVPCSCGATVHVTDADNVVSWLRIGDDRTRTVEQVEYADLYRLGSPVLDAVAARTRYDLGERHPGEWVDLATLTAEVATAAGVRLRRVRDDPPPAPWTALPPVVRRWRGLLRTLHL